MASSLSTIDDLTRPDHTFLSVDDECHYLGEYTARAGYAFSETNRLIQNLKKPMDRKGKPEWTHKEHAIRTFGQQLRDALSKDFLNQATLIPVPPSRKLDDPNYDDRMLRVLRAMQASDPFDIREIITMRINLDPVHLHGGPRSVEKLVNAFQFNAAIQNPRPLTIGIFDDLFTTGAHYVAMKRVLIQLFPTVPICGIFLARRAPNSDVV